MRLQHFVNMYLSWDSSVILDSFYFLARSEECYEIQFSLLVKSHEILQRIENNPLFSINVVTENENS